LAKLIFSVFALSSLLVCTSYADEKVYKYKQENGSIMFTNVKPSSTAYQVFKFDCYACDEASIVDWHSTPLFTNNYQDEILKASEAHRIEPSLIQAVIHAESFFQPHVVSKAGAVGLMQLMPKTAAALGVQDSRSVKQNINAGTQYLSQLLTRFNGNVKLALAAYNAGASNVKRFGGVPPFPETKAYIERVDILRARYQR